MDKTQLSKSYKPSMKASIINKLRIWFEADLIQSHSGVDTDYYPSELQKALFVLPSLLGTYVNRFY